MNEAVGSDVGQADNHLNTTIDDMGANVAQNIVKSKTTLPYIELLS